jgi:hypothetical protein
MDAWAFLQSIAVSRERLVEEYASGNISRRTFIRRLVAGGVSLGAAISYAHLIGQDKARALPRAHGDEYGLDDPPVVLIDPPGDLYDGDGNITLKGRIDSEGRSATYFFRVGRAANPGTWLRNTPQRSLDGGNGKRPVSEPMSGLRPGEEYFVELSAATLTGWEVSEQHRFFAPGGPPVPAVLAPQGTENNDGVVTVRGTVDTGGADTACYFRIGTSSVAGFWEHQSPIFNLPASFDGPTPIDFQVTGLQPNLTYYVRISASTSFTWVLSEPLSFVNGQAPPAEPEDAIDPIVVTRGISSSLDKVLDSRKIEVGVHANEPIAVKLKPFLVKGNDRVPLGRKKVGLSQAYVERTVKVPLSRAGRKALADRKKATIEIVAAGVDPAGNRASGKATFELS